jgi:uncharacterized protein YgbK (DUF1537 family)
MAKKDNVALAWLVGLGTVAVAGIGIYFYEKSQPPAPNSTAAAAAASKTVVLPGTTTPLTYAQVAQIAAQSNGSTLAAWQSGGIPAATWAEIAPNVQSILTALGYRANAT